MALDIYVGSLTRYGSGDWKSAVAQAAEASGIVHSTLRVGAGGEDSVPANESEVASLVLSWQASLAQALGLDATWTDTADQPYVTDRPGWPGYGALVLLAARLEHPELAADTDDPAEFEQSAAFQASSSAYAEAIGQGNAGDFPSLLGGAEWWLPLAGLTGTFQGPKLDGELAGMGTIDLLVNELRTIADRCGIGPEALGEALIMGAPDGAPELIDDEPQQDPSSPAELELPVPEAAPESGDLMAWGTFGLAVFMELAGQAQQRQLPLVLSY